MDQNPTAASHYAAGAGRELVAEAIEQIVPTLDLSQHVAMEAAIRLLCELQPSEHYLDAPAINWEASIDAETNIETLADQLEPQSLQPRWRMKDCNPLYRWMIRPLIVNEMTRLMNLMALHVPSVRAESYNSPRSAPPPVWWSSTAVRQRRDSCFGQVCFFISDRYYWHNQSWGGMREHFVSLSDSAAASLLLASRIFEAKHSYAPRESSELVPEILSAVPMDPFASNHSPMRFRLDPDGPTVWSVGPNGTDEDGAVYRDGMSWHHRLGGSADIVYGAAWRNAAVKK